jgi:quercetin dioxygenase-like cupin family protein
MSISRHFDGGYHMQSPASHATKIAPKDADIVHPVTEPAYRRPVTGAGAVSVAHASDPGLQVDPSDETIRLGPLAVRFLVTGEDSNGSVAAFEVAVPARQRLAAPAHSHDRYEETIYGTSGVLTWTVNGNQIDVGPGQTLCIPRGAIHRFDNNTDMDVRALCLVTPAAIGPAYFREAAEVIKAAAGAPPDPAKMIAIMRRHGITPAQP